jgi:protein-disulfide isomerase
MAGDWYRGDPDAKVVVVEFSDFQCPFCRKHVDETQPALDEQFVDTGEVMWIFKHFPLQIHPQAPAAGAAAECAGDQGKFWEMHELLFANVDAWSINDPSAVFTDLAGQLELDVDAFNACMDDPAALERVRSDMDEGAPFVQGTPTFIVLFNEEGRIIPGALPLETFSQALQEIIDQVQ